MANNKFANAHHQRLFDDIVRTGNYIDIDAHIETCERNAGLSRFDENRQRWLAKALTYRQIRQEAQLRREALMNRKWHSYLVYAGADVYDYDEWGQPIYEEELVKIGEHDTADEAREYADAEYRKRITLTEENEPEMYLCSWQVCPPSMPGPDGDHDESAS